MTDFIENRTYDEIRIGESASLTRTISEADIQLFAALSGDINPAHLDHEYAKASMFGGVIAHGIFSGALVSTVLGVHLPGPGTIYMGQTLRFTRPVKPGDRLTVTVTAREKFDDKKRVIFDCVCTNQDGKAVVKGEAEVIAPSEKIRRPKMPVPPVSLDNSAFAIKP
ncbi:MaoC/PaaZ C-terminal domain-containing protein [Uliginosibacterium sp. 31-16]|uniref:MaoC/PaaZ C-terminal domain-containing protein n=1 Tax=Uliginosibacterium sp. 31-16 TaxID=3068315 RepID=UPI00273E0965|nr:MaoC/PaaZ C-terminal domain-containing protein [Uliginosibacterium sp. 31-16]MDP5240965.1 MaoC/PaaZ C-terminal domain-containing protein [Uliginosibacterium sp. 31-16]